MNKLILVLLLTITSITAQAKPAAGVSGTLSLIPGVGQMANGDIAEGFGWFATVIGTTFSGNGALAQVGFDLWMYNMFDAYRDAGPSNRKFTNHNVFENYLGAYNPINIVDPIGAPIVALGAAVGASKNYPCIRNGGCILTTGFVGMGEEALFRGFLYPAFTDVFGGSAWAGAITSSAVFSVVHVTGGKANLAGGTLIYRFLLGMLFSWQVSRDDYDLRDAIFAHTWYDIFVLGGKIDGAQVKVPFYF